MQKKFYSSLIGIALSFAHQSAVSQTDCKAESGDTTIPLLELYTSEGCSSCPPADAWLSELDIQTLNVTPLAFHVDYWDYIGWKDPFALPEYTQRQHQIAKHNHSRFVYTPQFVLNGRDFKHRDLKSLKKAAKPNPAYQLRLALTPSQNKFTLNTVAVRRKQSVAAPTLAYIALYENNLQSSILAGENNGKKLHHDYVVRRLFGPYKINDMAFEQSIDLSNEWLDRNAGAAMFLQDSLTGEILQSLRLPFCRNTL